MDWFKSTPRLEEVKTQDLSLLLEPDITLCNDCNALKEPESNVMPHKECQRCGGTNFRVTKMSLEPIEIQQLNGAL